MNALILLGVPALPFLLAVLIAAAPQPALRRLVPWVAFPALALAALAPTGKQADLPWLLTGLELGVDPVGRVFLLLTAALWLAAAFYSRADRRTDPHPRSFDVFFLLAMSGNLGLVLAQDAVAFYLFFTLMSLSSWGLVIHYRTPEAWHAGKLYLILAVLGEMALFAGLVMAIHQAGATSLTAIAAARPEGLGLALLVIGLGLKAGMLPLHFWLPLAHPAAPVPASAVLSGAMIKAGLLGWLRVLPLDAAGHAPLGDILVLLGLAAAFFGALAGVLQRRPKTILAYSSISQMGLMTTGVGLALLLPAAREWLIAAVAVYALHHGLAKGALFLSVGLVDRLPPQAWQRFGLLALLVLPALALAGLPWTSGAVAKVLLKAPLYTAELAGWRAHVETALALAAVGTTLLMLRFLFRLRGQMAVGTTPPETTRWLPWALLAAMSLALPLAGAAIALTLEAGAVPLPVNLALVWPPLAGLALAALAWALFRRRRAPTIPEGDIAGLFHLLVLFTHWLHDRAGPLRDLRFHPRLRARGQRFLRQARHRLERGELRLTRWETLSLLYAASVIALYLALAWAP